MPTEKRLRQREGRQVRQEEMQRAQRRRQNQRRIIVGAVIAVVVIGVLFIANRGGSDSNTNVSASSTTSTTATSGSTAATTATTATSGSTAAPGSTTTTAKATTTAKPATTTTAAAAGGVPQAAPVPAGQTFTGETPCPKADGSSNRASSFAKAPPTCIDPTKKYTATFDTTEGTVIVALDTSRTPNTANNFVVLSRYHYYDGSAIFRTDPSIDIIQGGSPSTQSASDPGPGYTIKDEGGKFTYSPGDLVMARSAGPDSGGAQFFFVTGDKASGLNSQGTYVTFGKVSQGLDVIQKIIGLHQDDPSSGLGGGPSRVVTVKSVTIKEA